MTMGAEGAESDEVRGMWCTMRLAANAENKRTKGHKNIRYNVCVRRFTLKTQATKVYIASI